MLVVFEVITVLLVALAMSMALAHALEFPGKLRLDRDTYLAVQTIYYPGFTVAGIGEPLAVAATLILLFVFRDRNAAFWWVLASLLAVLAMHVVFWLVTQPVNRYWLRNQRLSRVGTRFFGTDRTPRSDEPLNPEAGDWKNFRDRWEYSHIVRGVLSMISLVSLTVAITR